MRFLLQLALFSSSLLVVGCFNSSSTNSMTAPTPGAVSPTSSPAEVKSTSTESQETERAGGFDSGGGDFIPAGLEDALAVINESISSFPDAIIDFRVYRKFISTKASEKTDLFFNHYMDPDYEVTKEEMSLLTKRAVRDVAATDKKILEHPLVIEFLSSSTPEEAKDLSEKMTQTQVDDMAPSLHGISLNWALMSIGLLELRFDILSMKQTFLNELEIKEDGPCYDFAGNPKPASVTEFNLLATVCISASEIAKLPKASLRENVTALLAHEVSHLLGYDEPEAEELQDYMLEVYSKFGIDKMVELGTIYGTPEVFEYNFIDYGQALAKHIEENNKVNTNDPSYDHLISQAVFLNSILSNLKRDMEKLRNNLFGPESERSEEVNAIFDSIFANIDKMFWPTFYLRRELRNYSPEKLEEQVISIFKANLEVRKSLRRLGISDRQPDSELDDIHEINDFLNLK